MSQAATRSHDTDHDAQSNEFPSQHSINPISINQSGHGAHEPDTTTMRAEHTGLRARILPPTAHLPLITQHNTPNANTPLPSIETDIKDEDNNAHPHPPETSSSQPETQTQTPVAQPYLARHASLGPDHNSQFPVPTRRIISLRQDQVQRRAAATFGTKPHDVKAVELSKVGIDDDDAEPEAVRGSGIDRSQSLGFIEEEESLNDRLKGYESGSRVFEVGEVATVSTGSDKLADVMVTAQHTPASDLRLETTKAKECPAQDRSTEGADFANTSQAVITALSRPTNAFNRQHLANMLPPPPPPERPIGFLNPVDVAVRNQTPSTLSAPSFNPPVTIMNTPRTTGVTLPTHTSAKTNANTDTNANTSTIQPTLTLTNAAVKNDPDPPPSLSHSLEPLPPFSPADLLHRFDSRMSTFNAEETKLMEEWDWWHDAFSTWAATSQRSDEVRGAKRLRTRLRKVEVEEEGVELLRGRSEFYPLSFLFTLLLVSDNIPFLHEGKRCREDGQLTRGKTVTKVVEAFESALAMMGD